MFLWEAAKGFGSDSLSLNCVRSARPEIGTPEILRIAPPLALDRIDS
jgi:hypothetical protein